MVHCLSLHNAMWDVYSMISLVKKYVSVFSWSMPWKHNIEWKLHCPIPLKPVVPTAGLCARILVEISKYLILMLNCWTFCTEGLSWSLSIYTFSSNYTFNYFFSVSLRCSENSWFTYQWREEHQKIICKPFATLKNSLTKGN